MGSEMCIRDRWQTGLVNPNFAEFAQNSGGLGIRVETADQLDDAFKTALEAPGPALVEVMTDAHLI